MIKNIVFDIGNILLRYNPLPYMHKHYSHDQELFELISRSKEWLMLDQGLITNAQATAIFIKRAPALEKEIRHYMTHWVDILPPIKEHVDVLEQVKKTHHVYLLSNFHDEAFNKVSKQYAFLRDVDGAIISARVHQLKPDTAIYQTLLETYHLNANECLFIDDSMPNIEAAKALGFEAMHCLADDLLEKKIKSYLR